MFELSRTRLHGREMSTNTRAFYPHIVSTCMFEIYVTPVSSTHTYIVGILTPRHDSSADCARGRGCSATATRGATTRGQPTEICLLVAAEKVFVYFSLLDAMALFDAAWSVLRTP